MHLLHCLFLIQAKFSIEVKAMLVPGKDNELEDVISHNNMTILLSQIPEARTKQEVIPKELVKLLMRE